MCITEDYVWHCGHRATIPMKKCPEIRTGNDPKDPFCPATELLRLAGSAITRSQNVPCPQCLMNLTERDRTPPDVSVSYLYDLNDALHDLDRMKNGYVPWLKWIASVVSMVRQERQNVVTRFAELPKHLKRGQNRLAFGDMRTDHMVVARGGTVFLNNEFNIRAWQLRMWMASVDPQDKEPVPPETKGWWHGKSGPPPITASGILSTVRIAVFCLPLIDSCWTLCQRADEAIAARLLLGLSQPVPSAAESGAQAADMEVDSSEASDMEVDGAQAPESDLPDTLSTVSSLPTVSSYVRVDSETLSTHSSDMEVDSETMSTEEQVGGG